MIEIFYHKAIRSKKKGKISSILEQNLNQVSKIRIFKMRGLTLFISDLRKCKGKEEETKRINKELANIRKKLNGIKPLSGYHKKKYLCKLLFMFLLGHECEFGRIEAINLLSSNAYSDKQIGYLFISVIIRDHIFMPLIINSLRSDLSSGNKVFQNLALQFIGNNPNKDIADSLASAVLKLLLSDETEYFVKQTAALTLLQILRIKSDLLIDACQTKRIISLISNPHMGVVTASLSLIEFLVKKSPLLYESCLPLCIGKLSRVVIPTNLSFHDYTYYDISAPWLTVKLLQLMQNFSAPTEFALRSRLQQSLVSILLNATEVSKSKKFEHNNAKYAVIFEAISLIFQMELDAPILSKAITILGGALKYKETNLRFMALDMMTKLTDNETCLDDMKMHWEAILDTLSTVKDITVKNRAIDLLYNICDTKNVKQIVEELLYYIETEPDSSHEAILKLAALAEKFCSDLQWYVHTIFTLLQMNESFENEELWHTLTNKIVENDQVQEFAAETAYSVLQKNYCRDAVIKAAAYTLGEFGYLIAKDPQSSQAKQLNMLHEKYFFCTHSTKALLLTTYMKFLSKYPELKCQVQSILKDKLITEYGDVEIQQRITEYLKLSEIASQNLLASIFDKMPVLLTQMSTVVFNKKKYKAHKAQVSAEKSTNNNIFPYNSTVNLCDVPNNTNMERNQHSKYVSQPNLNAPNGHSNLILHMQLFNESDILMKNQRLNNPANRNFLHNLLFNEKGVLFENDVIRVLITCEFNKHFGRFHLTYQNRSFKKLTNFIVNGCFAFTQDKYSIWFKPNNFELEAQESMEQDIHLECLDEFSERPSLIVKFLIDKVIREVKIILPLTVNKFSEPVSMSPQDFKKRWKNLGNLGQDVIKEIPAKYPMISGVVRLKLIGFRVCVIENVSLDPKSFHCAGIFYTRERRTGFLIQLAAISEVLKYEVTVRCSQRSLSETILNLIHELL